MGTVFEILIYSDRDEFLLRSLTEGIFENLNRFEQLMSRFIEESDIDFINKCAGIRPVRVSPEVFEIIKISLHYSKITDGLFDITVGPLMKLWGFYNKRNSVPSENEITDVLKKVGYKFISLDENEKSVFLERKGMEIDIGGVAKGWSVGKIREKLFHSGIKNFLINAGRSSVYACGIKGNNEYWTAKLPEEFIFRDNEIILKGNAVSVSGIFEKTVQLEGNKISHIINPLTGKPEDSIVMAIVISTDPLECEILSTAFIVMGAQKVKRFLKDKKEIKAILIYLNDKKEIQKMEINREVRIN